MPLLRDNNPKVGRMTIFAEGTYYIVHAEKGGDVGSGTVNFNSTLVDEDGNILVDEAGDTLVSEEATVVYGDIIHAGGTDYTVHAEA